MYNIRKVMAAIVVSTAVLTGTATVVLSGQDKVTICHASGLDGTTKFEELTIAYPAVFGQAGHFYENGTPQAGHEQDYLGPCVVEPTPTPDVSINPNDGGPTPTPTVPPTEEPSVTPAPSDSPVPPDSGGQPDPTHRPRVTVTPPPTDTE